MTNRRTTALAAAGLLAALAGGISGRFLSGSTSDRVQQERWLGVEGGATAEVTISNVHIPYTHVFTLKNYGTEAVNIHEVRSGCSCGSSRQDSSTVMPGQSTALSLTIDKFPTESVTAEFGFVVRSDRGDLPLRVVAKLPPPTDVLVRPKSLYLDPIPGDDEVARSVTVRVPRQCARAAIDAASLRVAGCDRLVTEITELKDTDAYRKFRIDVRCPAEAAGKCAGEIGLDTGCEVVKVRVEPSGAIGGGR